MSAIENEVGVGRCPKRPEGLGHVWAGVKASGDERNPCRFCGTPGRGSHLKGESGFFQEWCNSHGNSMVGVHVPMQSGTGSPQKAWPDGQPPEMAERAQRIVAEKKERDREARESGVGRSGQLRGKS